MVKTITGVVTWLKGWFFDKDEITTKEQALQTQINNKASQSDLNTLSSTVANKADKTGGVAQITDANANNYTNIGSLSSGATQQAINNALNTKIGELSSIEVIKIVSSLPEASASTMNKLYIVLGVTNTDIYYTQRGSASALSQNYFYSWTKMDTDILNDLSVDWSDIRNKPSFGTGASDFAVGNHSHGVINNDGTLSGGVAYNISGMPLLVYSNSEGIKKTNAVYDSMILHSTELSTIGTSGNANLGTILGAINTKLGQKEDAGNCITSIELVPKTTDSSGAIRLYYGDEQ